MNVGSLGVDTQAALVSTRRFAVAIQFLQRLSLVGESAGVPGLSVEQSLKKGKRRGGLFFQNIGVREVVLRFLEIGIEPQRLLDFRLRLGPAAHLPVHEPERESDSGIAGYLPPGKLEFLNRLLIIPYGVFRLPAQDAYPRGVRI